MSKYNYIKCLNPRHITNIYTGENILVECGKCESCLLKKSLARTTRCKIESACHRFTIFATLTFAQEYLPLMSLRPVERVIFDDDELYDSYECLTDEGEILGTVTFNNSFDRIALEKKCHTAPFKLPWLNPKLCQLFIKRLRKYIYKRTNEKIRVFYCGEYGPVHFRPHFHLLLWFDKDETSEIIHQAILACWSFGRVDSQLSTEKSAAYVSSYLNSNMYLPRVFKLRKTSPFSNHSFYLGESVFQDVGKEIQNYDFESATKKRFFGHGLNTDVTMWRSLKTRFVPKCKGYSKKSFDERVYSYQLNAKLASWTGETSSLYQARFIADYVRLYDFYSEDEQFCEMLQYFRYAYGSYQPLPTGEYKYIMPTITDYAKFQRSVYAELLLSRRFVRDFCNGDANCVPVVLKTFDEFYKYIDYENLKQQLKLETDISKTSDKDTCKFFFHNSLIVNELKESDIFKRYESSKKTLFEDFIKHKKLNDKNKIFIY